MKKILLLLVAAFLLCSSCTPKGERDFRFESKKDYKLICMTCSSLPQDLRNPMGPERMVYKIVFESEELDINGEHFKQRTYYVDRKDMPQQKQNRLPETDISIDRIQWVTVPTKIKLDGPDEEILSEGAEVIITSNNKVTWDTYDNTCR